MRKLFKDYEGIKYSSIEYTNATTGFAFKNVKWNTTHILNVEEKLNRIVIQQIYLYVRNK